MLTTPPTKLSHAETLLDMLLAAAEASEHKITLARVFGDDEQWTYQDLLTRSLGLLDGIQRRMGRNQRRVVVAATDPAAFLPAFWACQLGGITAVPLPPVRDVTDPNRKRLAAVVEALQDPLVLCEDRALDATSSVLKEAGCGCPVLGVDQTCSDGEGVIRPAAPEDAAWIQFSSGSTGSPKGVVVTHRAAVTNVAQMLVRSEFSADSVELGWMPLFHDMGLVGCHLLALAAGAEQVRMAPEDFLRRPALWMELATIHRATLLTGTNTALELFLRRVRPPVPQRWNLESVELFMVGAEPVSARTLRAMAERLAPAKLRWEAFHVPYGLAEATVGVSFSGPHEGLEPITLSRSSLSEGRAVRVFPSINDALEIVDVGRPLDGVEVRITDKDGVVLDEDLVGEIQISGPNVTKTLIHAQGHSEHLGPWLGTGDLGFFHGDRLYVCGRIKEVLIQNGRNVLAQDAEQAAVTDGIRKTVVCPVGQASEEQVALFIVPQDSAWKEAQRVPDDPIWLELARLARMARAAMATRTGLEADRTVILSSRQIPRTSSGKIRRFLLGQWLAEGKFSETERLLARAEALLVRSETGRGDEREPTDSEPQESTENEKQEQTQPPAKEQGPPDETPVSTTTKDGGRLPELLSLVRKVWAQVLGKDPEEITADQIFADLGGTSVKAQEILGLLEDALGLDLTADIMAGKVTPGRLASDLERLSAPARRIHPDSTPDGRPGSEPRGGPSGFDEEPIAVVGMAARIGPTENIEDFCLALLEGKDLTGPLPNRWPASHTRGLTCRAGSFLADPYAVDPAYFRADEAELAVTDPQQRLFAELGITALEQAGLGQPGRKGLVTGVFAGASQVGHGELVSSPSKAAALLAELRASGLLDRLTGLDPDLAHSLEEQVRTVLSGRADPQGPLHPATLAGNLLNMIAARTAHELGLEGPALTVDTACSSTAVAFHLACRSLHEKECDLALAGGVNLNLTPTVYRFFQAAGVLSRSGRCRPFTDMADGFVPGEGGAVFVLKRLGDALAAGDRIHALVLGSAVNNDGASLGIMAPNPAGQRRVIRRAWQQAGRDMKDAAFIEAHGTATAIGDPVEARVLEGLFPGTRQRGLGSVKANVGHLLGAAAAAGLVKAIQAIDRRVLPPALLDGAPDQRLGLSADAWLLPDEPLDLGAGDLVAGLSSFGFGGTNCHIVLGSPPPDERQAEPLPTEIVCLSGPTREHVQAQAEVSSRAAGSSTITDLATDMAQGRTAYPHRAFALASPDADPASLLTELVQSRRERHGTWRWSHASGPLRVAFLYPGQGSQRPHQALGLLRRSPLFRAQLERLAGMVPDQPLLDACYGQQASLGRLTPSNIAQPLLVVFQIAMTKLLAAAGLRPAAVCGHSVGELAAAWAAGMVDEEAAVQWAARRGALMQAVEQTGSMAAVTGSKEQVEPLLDPNGSVVIAAYNGPSQTVLSGPTDELDDLRRRAERAGLVTKKIPVGHAFHSPLMEPVAERLYLSIEELPTEKPLVPFASTVLGRVLVGESLPPDYWIDHVLQPVRYDDAFSGLAGLPIDAFVEIGPAGVLAALSSRLLDPGDHRLVLALTRNDSQPSEERDIARFQESMAKLWAQGAEVEWERIWNRGPAPRKLPGPVMIRRSLRSEAATWPGPLRRRTWRPLRPVRSSLQGTWLILPATSFDRTSPTLTAVTDALARAGGQVVWARWAQGLSRPSRHELSFDPLDSNQVEWACRMVGPDLKGIVITDQWAAGPDAASWDASEGRAPSDLSLLEATKRFAGGLQGLALLARSLAQGLASAGLEGLPVTLVTQAATDAQGAPDPFAAARRVGALAALEEGLDGRVRWLDLNPGGDPASAASVLAAGLSAALTEKGALRPLLEPLGSATQGRMEGPAVLLGAGGLASLLAPKLAEMGCSPIIVTSRSRDRASDLARKLADLGHQAEAMDLDLTRPEQVTALFQAITARYGAPGLVLHAATGFFLGSLSSRKDEDLAAVLGPKLTGTATLARVLENSPGTRVLLLSSVSASVPGLGRGMGDYAAANAFQDALARMMWQQGRPWHSLVLGLVRDTGVARGRNSQASESIDPALVAEQLAAALSSQQPLCFLVSPKDALALEKGSLFAPGKKVFSHGLQGPGQEGFRGETQRDMEALPWEGRHEKGDVRQQVPSVGDEPSMLQAEPAPPESTGEPEGSGPWSDQLRKAETGAERRPPTGRIQNLEAFLAEKLAKALGRRPEDIDPEVPFQKMGLDSLTAVDLVKEIEETLELTLVTTLLFEANTLSALTRHIEAELQRMPSTEGRESEQEDRSASRPGSATVEPIADATQNETDAPVFPLLGSQQTFLASNEYYPHLPGVVFLRLDIEGPMERAWLEHALNLLAQRHSMLSVRFFWKGRSAVQQPRGGKKPLLTVTAPSPGDDPIRFCAEVEKAARNEPFDLERGPLFRLTWCRLGQGRHSLMLALHHIAADAWSAGIVARQLLTILADLATGRQPSLPVSNQDFQAAAQSLLEPGPDRDRAKTYWKEHLAGAPTRIDLPFDGDPAAEPQGPFSIHQVQADRILTSNLERRAKDLDVSFFSLLLLSYSAALHEWSGATDFLVRTANARRDLRLADMEEIVGSFADSLPLRLALHPKRSLRDAAQAVQREVVSSLRHNDISSTEIAGLVGKRLGTGPRGVSPAGISFPDFDAPRRIGPLTITDLRAGAGAGLTQLGLIAWRFDGNLVLSYSFLEDLFRPDTIERMAAEHLEILGRLADSSPDEPLAALLEHLPTPSKGDETPAAPATTGKPGLPRSHRVSQMLADRLRHSFEEHAGSVALVEDGIGFSYEQLGDSAQRLACCLAEMGAGPGRLVGVLARPGLFGLRAVLGTIWSGAAYVPLDPDHPTGRTKVIMEDAGMDLLVTTADLLAELPNDLVANLRAVVLADRPEAPAGIKDTKQAPTLLGFAQASSRALTAPGATDPVYVMYTSGTTGRPKGVVVDNAALAPFHDWVAKAFGIDSSDRFVQTSSLAFGGSIRQMYSPLLAGARVCPVTSLTKKDPVSLVEFLEDQRITIWNSVPSLFLRLAETVEDMRRRGSAPSLDALRWILLGGENLPAAQVRTWRRLFGSKHRIANLYGSTETVVNATWFEVEDPDPSWTSVPIGKARSGSVVEIADEQGNPVSRGEVGEILVGGPSLAQGYLHAQHLTDQAFFRLEGRRFYHTGDLGRKLSSGDILYVGRRDTQVQIYGNRVELAEIEGLLNNHPSVRAAVVLAHRDDRTWRLTAWVEPADQADPPDPGMLRRVMAETLPPFMVPHEIVLLDRLPRNQAGKLDRRALADSTSPGHDSLVEESAEPTALTELTEKIVEAFRVVLRRSNLTADHDFFESGGDSILALELFRMLSEHLPDMPRPVIIYSHRTPRALARALSAHRLPPASKQEVAPSPSHSSRSTPAAGGRPGSWALTPMQAGFLLLERMGGGNTSNWSARIPLTGPLDPDSFRRSVERLMQRHDVLRSVIERSDQGWRQRVLDQVSSPLVVEDLTGTSRREREQLLRNSFEAMSNDPIDPGRAPAWRLALRRTGTQTWDFQLAFHHAFADGWSIALLGSELIALHDALVEGRPLDAERAPSYGMVADLLARSTPDDQSLRFWRRVFERPLQDVPLRRRDQAGEPTGTDRDSVSLVLDDRRSTLIRLAAARLSVPTSALYLALLARLLARHTKLTDQIIGLAHSGRDLPIPGIERVFGCLAQGLPLRMEVTDEKAGTDSLAGDIRTAAQTLTEALEHAVPPDVLARELGFGPNPPGSKFFLSIMDFSSLVGSGLIRPDWEQSRFSFAAQATKTSLFCSILTTDKTRITFHGDLDRSFRADLLAEFVADIDALAGLTDSGSRDGPPHVIGDEGPSRTRAHLADNQADTMAHAALVAYLPDPLRLVQLLGGLLPKGLLRKGPESEPGRDQARALAELASSISPAEILETDLGNSALLFVPLLADELSDQNPGDLVRLLVRAGRLAEGLGAKALSLAGMLPSATGYGQLVARAFEEAGLTDEIRLTTGHAATAAAIALNVQALLHRLDTPISAVRLAVVGFGSVGRAALDLLLAELGSPLELVICDHARRLEILDPDIEAVQASARCPVRTVAAMERSLPHEVLSADLILGASSTGDLLDPSHMEPGTVLLDDSFPPLCSPSSALARMERQGDILVAGAGRVEVPTLRRSSPLLARMGEGSAAPQDLVERLGPGMAGCRLESLLLSRFPDLPPVVGPVTSTQAKAYLDRARAALVQPAALHIGTRTLPEDLIDSFAGTWKSRIIKNRPAD